MKININVKIEHAEMLNKACKGEINIYSEEFIVDWSEYCLHAPGFLLVQIDYEIYVQLKEVSEK